MKLEWVLGLAVVCSVPLSIFVLFRRGMPGLWKLAASAVTVFYVLWFRDDLALVLATKQLPLRDTLPLLGHTLLRLTGLLLAILWPITLAAGVFARARDQAAKKVQRLIIFTALFWMALLVDVFTPPFAHNWISIAESAVSSFLKAAGQPPTDR